MGIELSMETKIFNVMVVFNDLVVNCCWLLNWDNLKCNKNTFNRERIFHNLKTRRNRVNSTAFKMLSFFFFKVTSIQCYNNYMEELETIK